MVADKLKAEASHAIRLDFARANRGEARNAVSHAGNLEHATGTDIKARRDTDSEPADGFSYRVFTHRRFTILVESFDHYLQRNVQAGLSSLLRERQPCDSPQRRLVAFHWQQNVAARGLFQITRRRVLADKSHADAKQSGLLRHQGNVSDQRPNRVKSLEVIKRTKLIRQRDHHSHQSTDINRPRQGETSAELTDIDESRFFGPLVIDALAVENPNGKFQRQSRTNADHVASPYQDSVLLVMRGGAGERGI